MSSVFVVKPRGGNKSHVLFCFGKYYVIACVKIAYVSIV